MAKENNTLEQQLDTHCRLALRRSTEQHAVEFQGRWYTWGDLAKTAAALSANLLAHNVIPGSKVALVARNHPDSLAAFLALLAGRYSVRMVFPFQSETALATDLQGVEAAAVAAAGSDLSRPVRQAMQVIGVPTIAIDQPINDDLNTQTDTITCTANLPITQYPPSVEVLTSGTTGKPKPFRLDYATISKHIVGDLPMQMASVPAALPATLLMFPISNISGLYSTLPPLLRGQPIVLLERFTVAGWHDFVCRFKPAVSGLPPAGVKMVLDANIPPADLACLTAIATGAAPLDPKIKATFESHYDVPILLSYGATEFGGPVTRMTLALQAAWGIQKVGSVGRALPGVKLRVVDPETGAILRAKELGILEVISPRISDSWIRTSDLATLDDDGFLFHHGRIDGAIFRGGFKILPATIEAVLLEHPAISQVCVIGVADERLGQVPAVAIEFKREPQQVSVEALAQFARDRLPATHVPVLWRAVNAIPRTPSMKVDQPAVRRIFESQNS